MYRIIALQIWLDCPENVLVPCANEHTTEAKEAQVMLEIDYFFSHQATKRHVGLSTSVSFVSAGLTPIETASVALSANGGSSTAVGGLQTNRRCTKWR